MQIEIALQPKQKLALQKSSKTPVLFFGGAKGGGKSFLVRARQVIRRSKFPQTHGVIIRKTFPELLSNHINMMWAEYPDLRQFYNKSEKTLYFPNGSTLSFSYLQSADDVFTYQGRQYEDIDVDEITQHEEIVFKVLRSSNRTSNESFIKAGGMPTMLLTGNPGGVGHGWCKRLFIDRDFRENERPEDFDFIQSFVQDNKALLDVDPQYLDRLKDLPEHLRKAYLEGDWNIHAGQAFLELSMQHIVEPFELPRNTRYFAGYDHGYVHPFSFVLFAVVPDGHVYVIRHFTGKGLRAEEIVEGIKKVCNDIPKKIEIFAGLDLWSHEKGGAVLAEQFLEYGLKPSEGYMLLKAKVDRKQGVAQIRKFIAMDENGDSMIKFFSNCKDVFNNVSSMQYDPLDPEDVLKVDADDEGYGGDDAYDAFRYGLMSRAKPNRPEKDKLPKDSLMYLFESHLKDQRRRELYGW